MADYLDKFQDLIKKRQASDILNLLNKKKNTGEIRTIDEFTAQLNTLIQDITNVALTPTLKTYTQAANDQISVEIHNEMLDRTQDDLGAAFLEAMNIDQVQKSHQAIIKDVTLKNLQYGVAELESKVSLYEFLSNDTNGFDNAIFSTFREATEARSSRTIDQASSIFLDPRTNVVINNDAAVDPLGERLTLSLADKTYYDFRTCRQIFDSESPQSTLIVQPSTSVLQNMLDNQSGTYWVQSLLFEEQPSFVKTKLEFDISGTRDINFIEIEPASKYPIVLESIFYLDTNNIVTELGQVELKITAPVVVQFRTITTKRLILVFRNENFSQVQFQYDPNTQSLIDQSTTQTNLPSSPSLTAMSSTLNSLLANPKIKDIIGLDTTQPLSFTGFEYQIGFDNIRTGIGTYDIESIYVSVPITLDQIGQVGLKTVESRPGSTSPTISPDIQTTTYDADDSMFFHSSIEYWVVKEDLDINGNILAISRFPILPLGVNRLNHERLVLSEKSDISKLTNDVGYSMFFTTVTNGNVKVYRNGLELILGDGDGWVDESTSADQTPDNNRRMRLKVRIQNPLPTDVFTISYTPLVSNTVGVPASLGVYSPNGLSVVDLIGDLSARSLSEQVVVLDRTTNADKISSTVLFLAIIIRSNTSDTSLTATVDEYTLAVGSIDDTKFAGNTI